MTCPCGKKDKCPSQYWVEGAGVLCVDSEKLMQCERVKMQMKAASELFKHKDEDNE